MSLLEQCLIFWLFEATCDKLILRQWQVKQPVLFLSGLQDEMVPPFHMKMLYAKAAARNPQCTFVEFPSGMHMDTWLSGGDVYWKTNIQFLEKYAPEKR